MNKLSDRQALMMSDFDNKKIDPDLAEHAKNLVGCMMRDYYECAHTTSAARRVLVAVLECGLAGKIQENVG